ncbi:MAG: hypothetical protein E4H37_07620 [Gemmatimonadales bacterium]|nr:MAG: hypothetical protein E4H37_07620 [Gemmatimonadales bacterium]
MPRWLRVIRGMVGTGLTFAVGVGGVSLLLGLIGLALGEVSPSDLRMVGKLSVIAFLVGVGFSGVLAITARGRPFEKISFRYVTALGAGGGFLYFLFIASMNGFRAWSPLNAIGNLVILTALGSGSAAATLLVARRAAAALKPGEELRRVGEGGIEAPLARRDAKQESGR